MGLQVGQIISEEQETAPQFAAEAIVKRLFTEIEAIAHPEKPDEAWLNKFTEVIEFTNDISAGFEHARAYALAVVKEHWDDLPLELRKSYGNDFMNYARLRVGKAGSTIDNYIATARLWLFNGTAPKNGTVEVVVRDPDGRPVLNTATGQPRTRTVEFEPYSVDLSKLLLLNRRAREGTMTNQLWQMLADDHYTCDDIKAALRDKSANGNDFYYFIEGPGLFVRDGVNVYCISEELNWSEYESDEKVKAAMDKFFGMLRIKPDAEAERIYQQSKYV